MKSGIPGGDPVSVFSPHWKIPSLKTKNMQKMESGIQGGSRERILPTCGPSLITPKGQQRDPDASDDNKNKNKKLKDYKDGTHSAMAHQIATSLLIGASTTASWWQKS